MSHIGSLHDAERGCPSPRRKPLEVWLWFGMTHSFFVFLLTSNIYVPFRMLFFSSQQSKYFRLHYLASQIFTYPLAKQFRGLDFWTQVSHNPKADTHPRILKSLLSTFSVFRSLKTTVIVILEITSSTSSSHFL